MRSYIQIFSPAEGKGYASFDLYLPASGDGRYYTCYHFLFEENPIKPALSYAEGPNDPANRRFYRIRTAHVVRVDGDALTPDGVSVCFRALQGGEIGLAFRENGAGDFVGGLHGDEVLTAVSLALDGREVTLDAPYFGSFETLCFYEQSHIYRCNTPATRLILHTPRYTVSENTLCLSQRVEWLADARVLHAAYMPMLTAQRLDPAEPSRILSDTVEFYGDDGALVRTFDTTPYGTENGGKQWDNACANTPASRVKVYGRTSGFSAETGYTVKGNSIPAEQRKTSLCIRYMKGAFDNKIYFDIGGGTAPTAGTVWESDVFYRLAYEA